MYERTDYPWVYSYGDKHLKIFRTLKKELWSLLTELCRHENLKNSTYAEYVARNLMSEAEHWKCCHMILNI